LLVSVPTTVDIVVESLTKATFINVIRKRNPLTIKSAFTMLNCPAKRKQALLGSNLPGVTGYKMSWARFFSRALLILVIPKKTPKSQSFVK